jgi:hypothetical protein
MLWTKTAGLTRRICIYYTQKRIPYHRQPCTIYGHTRNFSFHIIIEKYGMVNTPEVFFLNFVLDKYGGVNTPEARADMAKWVVWANAALDPVLFTRDIEVCVCVWV